MKSKKNNSGFNVSTIGKIYPKGTKFKTNKDGTVTPVYPKKKK